MLRLWRPQLFLSVGTMGGPSVPLSQTSFEVFFPLLTCSSILLFPIPILLKSKIFLCICSLYSFVGDGVVVRGRGYGVRSIRVDGNDALAMYTAVHAARKMAITEHRPILIEVNWESILSKINTFQPSENHKNKLRCFTFWNSWQALTYRAGHHSTSDDSSKYRPVSEIELWRMARDPVSRLRRWIESNDWWSGEAESELRSNVRKEVTTYNRVFRKQLSKCWPDSLPNNLSIWINIKTLGFLTSCRWCWSRLPNDLSALVKEIHFLKH